MNEEIEKKRPGPKPKPQIDVEELQKRVETLELLVCKFAALAGQRNLAVEFDPEGKHLKPWDPSIKDMRKYA